MGRRKSGLEKIVGGLASGVVIWTVWSFHLFPIPFGVIVFLGVVFGLLPVLSGIRQGVRSISDRAQARRTALEDRATHDSNRRENLEKTVLQIAKDRRGVVTPALVALHSDLGLDEAEQVLGSLASRGYAEMRVKENGTIDYLFHDLT